MKRLALFDLDHTLIPFDSDNAWGRFCVTLGWVDANQFVERHKQFFQQYKAGTLDIHAYTEFSTTPLRAHTDAEMAAAHARFMREIVEPKLNPAAQELLDTHKNDLRALVTATNDFITAPIAKRLGFEHLLAIRLEKDAAGRYTGKILGTPSFREGKIARVQQWLQEQQLSLADFDETYFYSDSLNDIPLLEMVSHPVVVDPDATLAAHAKSKGWKHLQLHSNIDLHTN